MDVSFLNQALEQMEDRELSSHIMRSKNYTTFKNSLNGPGLLDAVTTDRILAVCVNDLLEDLQYASSAIITITSILKKIQEGKAEYNEAVLLHTAATVVATTKKLLLKPLLRQLSFDALNAFPNDILIALGSSHSDKVIDLIYSPKVLDNEVLAQVCRFTNKLLKSLPPEQELMFVQQGLDVWFSTIIPSVLSASSNDDSELKEMVQTLELLSFNLKQIDYSNNVKWHIVLKNICDANGYPLILKNLLQQGCDSWHTLWKIFITILKDQITKVNKSGISPINALLPVVELAFKLDAKCRCQAFECWNVLIDNFSTELNEALVNKRLKLLMIPLKLNNAKVEETVVAKLHTWWHLIRQFYNKLDKYTDMVLIPFLQFCFGNPNLPKNIGGKSIMIPGQLNESLAMECIEVLVWIVGHVDSCTCCSLLSAGGRLISTKLLVDHWNLWVHCLQTAIKTAAARCDDSVMKRITCLWKGFVTVIGELPENQIRADLFVELLKSFESLFDFCKTNEKMADIIFYVLINTLISERQFRPLLKSKYEFGPLYIIVRIIQNTAMDKCYARIENMETRINYLKPLAATILEISLENCDELVDIAGNFNSRLLLWSALVEVVFDLQCIKPTKSMVNLFLWPMKKANSQEIPMENSAETWYRWYKLYNRIHPFLNPYHTNEVSAALSKPDPTILNPYYRLCRSFVVLKPHLLCDQLNESEIHILFDALSEVRLNDLAFLEKTYFPVLTDILGLFLNKVVRTSNVNFIKIAVKLVQLMYHHVIELLKSSCRTQKPIFTDNLLDNSRTFLDKINKNNDFAGIQSEIADAYKKKAEVEHAIACISLQNNKSDCFDNKLNEIVTSTKETVTLDKQDFTTPEPKITRKTKSKRKELDIVNTVVENGEEFVVVKSHWKFNPKTLTENQKEKLKRKREDIPALYQDLSQSQDEFKLKTWKTDSQDATTSKESESNSKSNDDPTIVLQQLSSADVVPNIIENIFHDSAHKKNEKSAGSLDNDNNNKVQKTPTVSKPKGPRLALKDRVFRNVRNLIEKSGTQSDINVPNQVVEDLNQTFNENALKTPVTKVKIASNVTHSAPPKIVSERPTRAIKKPKKFADVEIFDFKKKRRSNSDAQQDNKISENVTESPNDLVTVPKEDDKNEIPKSANKDIDHEKKSDNNESENLEPLEMNVPSLQVKGFKETQINVKETDPKADNDKLETEMCPTQDTLVSQDQIIAENDPIQDGMSQDEIIIENDLLSQECPTKIDSENSSQLIEDIASPRHEKVKKKNEDPSTVKKKRSRIEKQLLIDMVEGHPVLQQTQSMKRVTRKNLTKDANDTVSKRRKSLIEKSNKIKAELGNAITDDIQSKEKTSLNSKSPSPKTPSPKAGSRITQTLTPLESQAVELINSQDQSSSSQDDMPMSEDVIESSQDSTLTTISVKSATKKRVPIVVLDKDNPLFQKKIAFDTENLFDKSQIEVIPLSDTLDDICNQEDIELPKNKTMSHENSETDLTENMDTEPIDSSGEVIVINDDAATPIVINTEDTVVGKETQEVAEADTLPMEVDCQSVPLTLDKDKNSALSKVTLSGKESQNDCNVTHNPSQEDVTPTLSKTAEIITDLIVESSNTGSPIKDEVQRKKEFLNDTIEISPIKTLSPVREKKSPSPETSSDYVVIKLTSPVQSNGEPYNEKCDSPEVFTDDKVSPDKRDVSPPRKQVITTNSSPSSSLSLKKNKPQMRFNGRAAQMIGLCVPEKLQILNLERSENDEGKKTSPVSTPARRNLKRFYNSSGDSNENVAIENESEENEKFLKFTRPLPSAESSPCNPILKRKLVDIADDTTISPASKRKRVSFHDPPVSTTVAVQKYIEPCGIRSPSNSAIKRQERQFRALTNARSPKRLDNVFRLETVLTKAVESFSEENNMSNDTLMSLDETPAAEVVKTSDLNDTDPIWPELLDCIDPIENIASELASPSTKDLLIKELMGKVETIADLARMTELEVNRLCIKAPKVKVVKKVLSKYASERAKSQEVVPVINDTLDVPITITEVEKVDMEAQTNEVLTKNSEMQTMGVSTTLAHTQTDATPIVHCGAQTIESGEKSTREIVSMCLNERSDFIDQLSAQLQQSSIRQISEQLPFNACLSLLKNKLTPSNSTDALNQVIVQATKYDSRESKGMDLNILQEHLCKRFGSKDLILFCSELLKKIHDKPS